MHEKLSFAGLLISNAQVMNSFWNENKAVPTWIQSWFLAKPDYLRTERPPIPFVPHSLGALIKLDPTHTSMLAHFWRAHYGESDWFLDADDAFASSYLIDPDTTVLGLFAVDQTLLGTIAAVPFGTTTRMSHGALFVNKSFHVVEGMCVHRNFRSRGIASLLMAAIDSTLCESRHVPFACLWAREIPSKPVFSTFLTAPTYASIPCDLPGLPTFPIEAIDMATFQPLWEHIVRRTLLSSASIGTESIDNRRGGLRVWKATVGVFEYYVVVSDTRRKTLVGRKPMVEVVWCGSVDTDGVIRLVLEGVARQYTGLFFCTSDLHTGGAQADWVSHGWSYGHSGLHAWSMYNYAPPSFGSCKILALREEV